MLSEPFPYASLISLLIILIYFEVVFIFLSFFVQFLAFNVKNK